jgi:diacylglycerol kinase family enzyme
MYGETNKGPDQMKEFINKVATKLGLPSEKVEAAVKSVRKEWMEKMITDRIQEAVQKGTITQAEAGQIGEWLKNRPDGVQKLMGQMFGQMGGMMGMGGRKGPMGSHM